jgi:hypothetical protein
MFDQLGVRDQMIAAVIQDAAKQAFDAGKVLFRIILLFSSN